MTFVIFGTLILEHFYLKVNGFDTFLVYVIFDTHSTQFDAGFDDFINYLKKAFKINKFFDCCQNQTKKQYTTKNIKKPLFFAIF